MKNKYLLLGLGIGMVLILGGVGFVFSQNLNNEENLALVSNSKPENSPPAPSPTVLPQESDLSNTNEVIVINVEAGNYYYKPNTIRVKKGQKVKIELRSVSMMHDFVIDELNVRSPIVQSGKTGIVEFVADKVGSFEYYCSVANHKQMGQVGTLIVE